MKTKKHILILITILFIQTFLLIKFLSAKSIFEILLPDTNHHFISNKDKQFSALLEGNYFDYFYTSNSLGEKHFCYMQNLLYQNKFYTNDYELSIRFQKLKNKFYTNNLSDISDCFNVSYNSPKLSIGVSKNFNRLKIYGEASYSTRPGGSLSVNFPLKNNKISFKSSLNPIEYKVNYDIQDIDGQIPLSVYIYHNQVGMSFRKFSFQTSFSPLIPIKKQGHFSNKIYGFITEGKLTYKYHRFNPFLQFHYGNISAKLKYKGDDYGYLDHLQFYHYLFCLKLKFYRNHQISSGITGIKTWINPETYFDIWPFTYWDIFLASRTRLKKFDNTLNLPFTSFNFIFPFNIKGVMTSTTCSIGYYHFLFEGNIIYKERYFIIYPVMFGYKTKRLEISPDIDGIFRINVNSSLQYGNFQLSIIANQLIPIDFSKVSKAPSPEEDKIKEKERGGTHISIQIGYNF